MRRERPRSQRLINHNCFNSINDVFRARSRARRRQAYEFVGVFFIVMAGPARGRRGRANVFRAALPCLALIAADRGTRGARPDRHAGPVQPDRDGFVSPQDSPLRRTSENRRPAPGDAANDARLRDRRTRRRRRGSARSRPTAFPPPAAPPSSGYNSLNRKRKKPKYLSGPGQAEAAAGSRQPAAAVAVERAACGCRFRRRETANKTPIPPAMAGTVVGQPPRKRLKVDDDPFGAVGDYAGSFLIKSAVELRGGYDTNPGRTVVPKGSPFYVVAPEFLAVSDWERHALVADLRGSFTGYSQHLPAGDRRHGVVGADRSRPAGFHRPCRRPSRCQPRHPPARHRRGCASPPTIPAARTSRPASPNIRSTRRSAAPSASIRISTGCSFPPAPPSTAPSIRTRC